MSFNPNQLLNNPANLLGPLAGKIQTGQPKEAVPPPPFDPQVYINAYNRLGMLGIENVADLGCGPGNFVSVMVERNQKPEVYLGIDNSHKNISTAKAAYPGWNFIYGDFTHERVRAEYERYGAFLMLNLLDTMEDDINFLTTLPQDKPFIFSLPKAPREGSLRWAAEGFDIHERYSSILAIRSIGRFRNNQDEEWSMVMATRW